MSNALRKRHSTFLNIKSTTKKTMKRRLLPILFFFLSTQIFADKYLTVWQNGKEIQSFEVSDKAKVSYDGGNVLLMSGNTTLTFLRADMLKFAFTDTPTAIAGNTKEASVCKFAIKDNLLKVNTGETKSMPVDIYGTDGSVAISGKTDADGNWSADLSALARGTYIFKSKSSSFKFILK